ncbi:MAG TPA: zinc ribbon domain-containing protein [Dehalococcoidia bacterium]|nr:zinc ribbon domain-containing protein [Dehalococcoidia bacterium]
MPVYEYDCPTCGKRSDVFLKSVSAPDPTACPRCGAAGIRRAISRIVFIKSAQTKLDELDPKYEKMIDASSPDLSMDNLIKKYQLDKPITDDGRGAPDF